MGALEILFIIFIFLNIYFKNGFFFFFFFFFFLSDIVTVKELIHIIFVGNWFRFFDWQRVRCWHVSDDDISSLNWYTDFYGYSLRGAGGKQKIVGTATLMTCSLQ